MREKLESWAEQRGYQVAWGPASLVDAVRSEVAGRRQAGELDADLYSRELASFAEADDDRSLQTVVMVSTPRPAHLVCFQINGSAVEAIIPPTYVGYRPHYEAVRQDLQANGLPGARVEQLAAPLKALAAHLGLVRYGRNNITYASGCGSYLQLCGYLTNVPLAVAGPPATGPQLLAECEGCTACLSACPTGAIDRERVLLHAERCLTFANENPGPWPDYVPAWSHRCLLGCLVCQRVCPANPKLPIESSGVSFSAAETEALLNDDTASRARFGIRTKLAFLGQPYSEPVLGRNLRALLDSRRSKP